MAERAKIPVTVHLSKDAHAKLAERAAAARQDIPDYISTFVESMLQAPRSLEEISGPVYQRFVESGASDEALSEELEHAKHARRALRRGRRAS